jgi:hypothetical protein
MRSPCSNGLVGLIAIEASADDGAPNVAAGDETLAQIFAWLARGNRALEFGLPAASRFAPAGRFLHDRVPAVTADCQTLGIQLDRAAVQLRRLIAQQA